MPETDAFDLHETKEGLTGGTWTNVTVASWQALNEAASGNAKAFVWPDEGRFKRTGSFEFNEDHQDFQPLLIDKITASMMLKLHDSLNNENQEKFKDWVSKGRGQFAFLWEITLERVTITGFTSR